MSNDRDRVRSSPSGGRGRREEKGGGGRRRVESLRGERTGRMRFEEGTAI